MSWRERAKRILKKFGKVAGTAAALSLGIGIAGPAIAGIGTFLVSKIGKWLGIGAAQVPAALVDDTLNRMATPEPEAISTLFDEKTMNELADKIAVKLERPKDDVYIAVHASVRDLQSTLTDLNSQMAENHELIRAILEESQMLDKKMDKLLDETERTGITIKEMHRTLERVERRLNNAFQHFAYDYLQQPITPERLVNLSPLQRQDVTLASRYEIAFDPDLYVNRISSERAFQNYMEEAMPDQNLFLVLGNAGLGKTWLMAQLSANVLEQGHPTFFVPLKQGLTPVLSLFRANSLVDLVRLLNDSLRESNQRLYLFLDGLDEMESHDRSILLSDIASCRRFKAVSIILSCRLIDWRIDPNITDRYDSLSRCIYRNPEAMRMAHSLGVHTPLSIALEKFTNDELNRAAIEYGIPTPPPSSLIPLLQIPYVLRLIAHYYNQTDHLPDPTHPEMLELFADVDQPFNTILGRLGILYAPRDLLMEISEQILSTPKTSVPLGDLKIRDQENFNLLLSSGMLSIVLEDYGSSIHITPFFTPLLAALLLQKYQHDRKKFTEFNQSLQNYHPGVAKIAVTLAQIPLPMLAPEVDKVYPTIREESIEREYTVHENGVLSLAVTSDGQHFVSSSIETVNVWKLQTGALRYSIQALEKKKKVKGIVLVVVSPDGRYIVSGSDDAIIRIWDFNNGSLIRTLEGHEAGIYSVAVSPDSHYIASGSWDKKVGVWEMETGNLLFLLKGHKGGVSSVAISPNSRYIVSGSQDETVRVWESGTGTLIHTLKGHKDPINSVAISPDGRHIISGSEDKTVRVWMLRTGELLHKLKGHKKWVRAVAVSKDGRYIFSGSEDKTIKVWDLTEGELLHTFEGHDKPVYSVSVSPDGLHILSGSLDKTVRIWPLNQIKIKA